MSKAKVFNFTVASINQLPIPAKGRDYYQDAKENGLSLYVTSGGAKTFFVRKRVKGANVRMTIGSAKDISVEQARKEAQKLKGQVALGEDPIATKKKEIADRRTFGEHFHEYLERYSKKHKKSWKYDEREVHKFLSHWFNRRLSDISKGEVQKLVLRVCDDHGLYLANRILERIRAMYNKAIEWGWEGTNPTNGIKKYRERKRDRFILPNEMPFLFQALQEESNETARDYFMILLLVGQRRTNVLMMRWEEINWEHQIWRIPDTKSGEPVIVPLTEKAIDILSNRKKNSQSPWVFPGEKNSTQYYTDPSRAWDRIRKKATLSMWSTDPILASIIEHCRREINPEVAFDQFFKRVLKTIEDKAITPPAGLMDVRMHDIRRTFGSYQAITGASLQIIGKSLGHKSSDATQIYARLNIDPVRASIEKATEAMFTSARLLLRKTGEEF